jgi:hypothetical protein
MKRTLLILAAVGCGGSNGEIDLVLENKTSSSLVVQQMNECGAGHLQILDANGRALAWSCGGGSRASSEADFAPILCVNRVRSIASSSSLEVHWDGYYFEGSDCSASGESFRARFCFGTRSSTRTDASGQQEQVVDDLRCEDVPFQLGVDLEARYVVE